jgi:hypothetical protein
MTDLLVFQLEFTDKSQLEKAFSILMEHDGIASCEIDSRARTARFMATARIADELVERIHAYGGLRWCSRHTFRARTD